AFDGDGIVTYGAPGNPRDNTGYGGPNAYFTDINGAATSGTVNFITPIPPGGSDYFSLEDSLAFAIPCAVLIDNALAGPTGAGTPTIQASFTPNLGFSLLQAAAYCGFANFDWQQTVTSLPSPSPFFQVGNATALIAPPSFLDPPPGGYTFELTRGYPNGDHRYPFYYDPNSGELQQHETSTTLSFSDTPTDACLSAAAARDAMAEPPRPERLWRSRHISLESTRTAPPLTSESASPGPATITEAPAGSPPLRTISLPTPAAAPAVSPFSA
ncbi:MAG: hypothetical protein JO022_08570, partial [Acidobacteriaceae bacterium]|nr:hypothetical protein [Acidobacteriaceae bacterium]